MKGKHPNSLANLENGGRSRKRGGLDRKGKLIYVTQNTSDTLNESGNASAFVELLLEAHLQNRLLTPQEIREGRLFSE